MRASARMTCDFLNLKEGDTALLCMPLDYIAGKMMVVRALERGLKLIDIPPSGHPFADISLQLVNSLWLQICDMIIVNEEKHSSPDITDIMNLISQYRIALERLLSAPYGSLDLISIPILHSVIDQIHQHWK